MTAIDTALQLVQYLTHDNHGATTMHAHQCGLTTAGDLRAQGYGCGHVWAHESGHLRDHHCPVCGKGPFTVQVPLRRWNQQLRASMQRIQNARRVTREEAPDPRDGDLGPIAENE